nr:hypothetical protein [Tanacetum cinerariifolium]
MKNPNHLNEPNEAILEVNPVVTEPNQVVDIYDPNKMVDILDDIGLVDYDEEDPEEDLEEEPEEDGDIELEDDAELIFLYEDKIGEKERKLLNHDLENVERALGNVLERMSARMERDTTKRRLHESRVWNKMFYLDMVRIGAVLKPPSDDEDTERLRKKSKNSTPDGIERHFEPQLVFWSCITLDGDIIMPPKAMSEARTHEIIRDQVTTSMAELVANMNRRAGGAGASGAGAGGARAGGAGAGDAGAGDVGAGGAGAGDVGAGGAGAGGAGADDAGVGGAGVGGTRLAAPEITRQIQRISLTGFPAQSIGSLNNDILYSPCLLVLITGTSQSKQHESCKSPTKSLFDVGSSKISIFTVNTFVSLRCSGKISRKMRRTLYYSL